MERADVLRRDRPDARLVHAREARRDERRQARRRRGLAGLRRRRLSRRHDRPRLHVRLQLLRHSRTPWSTATTSCSTSRKTSAYRAPARRRPRSPASRSSTNWREKLKHRPDRVPPEERREGRHRAASTARSIRGSASSKRSKPRKNSPHYKTHARPARTAAAASRPASGSTSG